MRAWRLAVSLALSAASIFACIFSIRSSWRRLEAIAVSWSLALNCWSAIWDCLSCSTLFARRRDGLSFDLGGSDEAFSTSVAKVTLAWWSRVREGGRAFDSRRTTLRPGKRGFWIPQICIKHVLSIWPLCPYRHWTSECLTVQSRLWWASPQREHTLWQSALECLSVRHQRQKGTNASPSFAALATASGMASNPRDQWGRISISS